MRFLFSSSLPPPPPSLSPPPNLSPLLFLLFLPLEVFQVGLKHSQLLHSLHCQFYRLGVGVLLVDLFVLFVFVVFIFGCLVWFLLWILLLLCLFACLPACLFFVAVTILSKSLTSLVSEDDVGSSQGSGPLSSHVRPASAWTQLHARPVHRHVLRAAPEVVVVVTVSYLSIRRPMVSQRYGGPGRIAIISISSLCS